MHTSQLRREIRSQRRQLSAQTQLQHSQRIQRLASNLNPFNHSHRIAFYLASRGEIDPFPLMMRAIKAGKQVFLPVLRNRPKNSLWFAAYRPGDPLVDNCYGIPEPLPHRHRIVMPWSLDLVFVPLVAFDERGNRMGMGGGYYDRTFAFKRLRTHWRSPKLIGLAHELQHVRQLQPQPWDIPLDGVITEQSTYRFDHNTNA